MATKGAAKVLVASSKPKAMRKVVSFEKSCTISVNTNKKTVKEKRIRIANTAFF